MSSGDNSETFGQLLHGTARAWRQNLDHRLKPMGLSQAKWRTLMHLSLAGDALTQAEIAARLGVEEPSVVTLLHRLEREEWITRSNSQRDRRCKMVLLGRRAQRVIGSGPRRLTRYVRVATQVWVDVLPGTTATLNREIRF